MRRLVRAFSYRVDDHVSAFLAGEVSALCGVFEAIDSGLVRELHRFDGAIGSLHGNCLRAGIDFTESAGENISRSLGRERNCEAHGENQDNLKKTDAKANG
jgi:hypothetical protein